MDNITGFIKLIAEVEGYMCRSYSFFFITNFKIKAFKLGGPAHKYV